MASLVRLLAGALVWTGLASLPPALASAHWNEGLTPAFLATALGCFFLAGAMGLASSGPSARPHRLHVLGALAGLWLLAPLAAAPATAMGSGLPLMQAWFETLSAFTTTGFSMVQNAPRSLYVWFALLQLSGGLFTIVCALAVLAPAGLGGLPDPTGPDVRTAPTHGILAALREVSPLYFGAAGLAFLGFLLTGHSPYVAFCIASAVTSTGSHLPPEAHAAIQTGAATRWLVLAFLLFAASSIRWRRALVDRRIRTAPDQAESLLLLGSWLVAGLIMGLLLFVRPAGLPLLEAISTGLFTAATLISTSGIPPEASTFQQIPRALQLILALIGGGALSAAGGLKLFRLRAMLLWTRGEVARLISPNLVQPVRPGDGGLNDAMPGIWSTLLAFIGVLALVLASLSATLPSFEAALTGAVAALTNTGPLYEAAGAGWPPIATLPTWSLLAAAFAMIAGRLEAIALVVLLHLGLWRT